MKKTYVILFILGFVLLPIGNTKAQQVISATGGTLQNTTGTMSYTLGELVIDTRTSGTKTLTQGFHQPKITVTAVNELTDLNFTVTAFPNPTSDMVKLKVEKVDGKDMEYFLSDSNGKLVSRKKIESNETEIPFGQLAPTIYILKIQVDGKEIKTFKIVKL